MRVLTYRPNQCWPTIRDIPTPEAPICITAIQCLGISMWALSDPASTEPNRLIDGHVINGSFDLCHKGFQSLGVEYARKIRDEVEFEMAQYMVVDFGFAAVSI